MIDLLVKQWYIFIWPTEPLPVSDKIMWIIFQFFVGSSMQRNDFRSMWWFLLALKSLGCQLLFRDLSQCWSKVHQKNCVFPSAHQTGWLCHSHDCWVPGISHWCCGFQGFSGTLERPSTWLSLGKARGSQTTLQSHPKIEAGGGAFDDTILKSSRAMSCFFWYTRGC